jgi:hypothetical protein
MKVLSMLNRKKKEHRFRAFQNIMLRKKLNPREKTKKLKEIA